MNPFPILYDRAEIATSKLVDCRGCTSCCEKGGLVYVRDDELPRLKKKSVPIVAIDGLSFIRRKKDGSCPMLDRTNQKCSIYADRPLCCRLFPLDVLAAAGRLKWAISGLCPERRKYFGEAEGCGSKMGGASLNYVASSLNSFIEGADRTFFRKKELVSDKVEILEQTDHQWTILSDCVVEKS
jgi:uncharacterized protein